jgi:hypothetical protein
MWAGEQEQYNGETDASGPPIEEKRTEKVGYNVQTVADAKHHLYVERDNCQKQSRANLQNRFVGEERDGQARAEGTG